MHISARMKSTYWVLLILLVGLYLMLALIKIRYPGVFYDEILFGNAALGTITEAGSGLVDNIFIYYRVGNFPVFLMSYMGALKAYLYYPIFKTFGVSVYSIRMPPIILSAVALFLLFLTTRDLFNNKMALITLFLLVTDASFINQTRYDNGPTVIEFFCKVLILYFFTKIIRDIKINYIIILVIISLIALFNKLSFIWFVNSFFIASIFYYWSNLKDIFTFKKVGANIIYIIFPLCAYLINLCFFIFIYKLLKPISSYSAHNNIFYHIISVLNNLKILVTGESFNNYVIGNNQIKVSGLYIYIFILLFFIGFILNIISKQLNADYKKKYIFILIIFFATLFQIFITKEAGANWHLFALMPSLNILIAYSLFTLTEGFSLHFRRKLYYVQLIMLIIIISSQCTMNYKYIQAYDKSVNNIAWSKSIYDLIDLTKNSTRKYVSIDWGIHTQLTSFDHVNDKYLELSYKLNYEKITSIEEKQLLNLLEYLCKTNANVVFIAHPENEMCFKNVRKNLKSLLEKLNCKINLIKTIKDDNGRTIFELYSSIR